MLTIGLSSLFSDHEPVQGHPLDRRRSALPPSLPPLPALFVYGRSHSPHLVLNTAETNTVSWDVGLSANEIRLPTSFDLIVRHPLPAAFLPSSRAGPFIADFPSFPPLSL